MVYGAQATAQRSSAAFKVKKIIHFYPQGSIQQDVLGRWLTFFNSNGYGPNGNELAAATGMSKNQIKNIMAGVQRDLIRIGLKPLRADFFAE